MVGNRRGWSGRRGEQGSSLIYVILSITLLSVFSCGYMAVSRYQMKSALTGKSYMEAQITAKTIHSTGNRKQPTVSGGVLRRIARWSAKNMMK